MVDHPIDTPPTPRIALAHDWLCGFRGGEAVLDRIARLCAQIGRVGPLYTMFDDGRPLAPAIDALNRTTAPLNSIPGASGSLRRWLLPAYPSAVASLSRSLQREHAREPFDLLVSTSSAAIKGLRPPDGVPHVCYCHAPARYIWSRTDEYEDASLKGRVRGAALRAYAPTFKRWDKRTAEHVTTFIANSTHTAREIERCFGRTSEVIHPPARTDFFTLDANVVRTEAWLFVGALEPYKRADLAIEAANRAKHALRIIGGGSDEQRLRALAGPTVEFLGRVSDERLRDEYRRARVLLFPQVEDFGIVAVEAQACGLPVVARGEGGSLDSVSADQTGVHFQGATAESLLEAIERAPSDERACRANAERFSEDAFDRKMESLIRGALGG